MSFRNTLGIWNYNVRRQVTRTVITEAIRFRAQRLIVFLTPGFDSPNGGIMSISWTYRESISIRKLHGAKVALCVLPGDPPLLKYTWFKNRNYLLDFEALLRRCGQLDYLMIHIPEYAVNRMNEWLSSNWSKLKNVKELHLNVLIQHIDILKGQNVKSLERFGKVTCTTAHEAYTNAETRAAIGVSLHRLSTCNGPERYKISSYEEKQPLLMVSHDPHPLKEKVLQMIAKALPELKIQVIQNLTLEEYLQVAQDTKWSLTFGEGLDSYFTDPVLSGGVSFAVYNDRFFTPEFPKLETVYPSWDVLIDNITTDLRRLDEPVAYERCWRQAFEILSNLYSTERFRENLRLFYRGAYTFP